MPIRHGDIAASRASIWPRDHFCRSTIAPRRSRPTTWNEFFPISMPIVAMVAIDLLDMAVLRLTLAPSRHHSPVGQEHGRTIPLADHARVACCSWQRRRSAAVSQPAAINYPAFIQLASIRLWLRADESTPMG